MSANYKILLIIGFCFLIFILISETAILLSKNKKKITSVLCGTAQGLGYASEIANVIKPFLPSIAGTTIEIVLKYAYEAILHVETIYKAALATDSTVNDTRTAEALSLIKSALALQDIQETADIDKLINTVIPLLVLALPKTHNITTQAQQI
jgi:hypothetical protein